MMKDDETSLSRMSQILNTFERVKFGQKPQNKMINNKPKFTTVRSFDQILVKIQSFSMKNSLFSPFLGIFHTMVILIIVGSLFKIPPLRSGGTSAQKIKEI